jgi:hypothetical protein
MGAIYNSIPRARTSPTRWSTSTNPLQEILKPNTPYTTNPRESAQLHESIARLSAIVERTSSTRKAEVLEHLKRVDQTYR